MLEEHDTGSQRMNTKSPRDIAVVIMAAGKGTRMKNPDVAKVMFAINGRPMVEYVVDAGERLGALRILLIVGWQKDSVIAHIGKKYPNVEFVEQLQQNGTGHAVMQTEKDLKNFSGDLLVLSGDVPLLTHATLTNLMGIHAKPGTSATILTAELDDPFGYGRIIRNAEGNVVKIVEQKDASTEEQSVKEINSGIYLFDSQKLFNALARITPANAQGEYYLTDVFAVFWQEGWNVSAVKAVDSTEVMGINTLDQLETAKIAMDKLKSRL
jgi:UDP-N-acetylglucosamine diphosphorylase/glucosamine-1-phosphate N-acetyltransferase